MPWEYEDHLLKTLCEECHAEVESERDEMSCLMGAAASDDASIIRLARAVQGNPIELTFFGWAASELATAIHHYESIMNNDYPEGDEDYVMQSAERAAFAAIKEIVRAIEGMKNYMDKE